MHKDPAKRHPSQLPRTDAAEVASLYSQGLSVKEISMRLGVTKETITKALRRAEVAIRSGHESSALRHRLLHGSPDDSREWRPIAGYGDAYEVSSDGVVRNVATGLILSAHKAHNGYLRVTLYVEAKVVHCLVHRAVAMAFYGQAEAMEVNHKDGNKQNNNVDNLEWVTRAENSRHYHYVLKPRRLARGIYRAATN